MGWDEMGWDEMRRDGMRGDEMGPPPPSSTIAARDLGDHDVFQRLLGRPDLRASPDIQAHRCAVKAPLTLPSASSSRCEVARKRKLAPGSPQPQRDARASCSIPFFAIFWAFRPLADFTLSPLCSRSRH